MINKIKLIAIISLVIFQAGCCGLLSSDSEEKPKGESLEKAKEVLKEADINADSLWKDEDGNYFIMYEASNAREYDAQLLHVWGTIFGSLAYFAEKGESISIVNTAGGDPILLVRAWKEDIEAFAREDIDMAEFFRAMQITYLKSSLMGSP